MQDNGVTLSTIYIDQIGYGCVHAITGAKLTVNGLKKRQGYNTTVLTPGTDLVNYIQNLLDVPVEVFNESNGVLMLSIYGDEQVVTGDQLYNKLADAIKNGSLQAISGYQITSISKLQTTPSSNGLGGGYIALIVILIILAVIAVAATVGFYFYRKRIQSKDLNESLKEHDMAPTL